MKISKTALDQYKNINKLMQKCNATENNEIKSCLKHITNFGFDVMNNIDQEKTLKTSNITIANKCLASMRRINEMAIKKSIKPIFIMKNDIIATQSINMINAIIIINSVQKSQKSF